MFIKKETMVQACNFIKNETLAQVFSCQFYEIPNKIFFRGTPPVAASVMLSNVSRSLFIHINSINIKSEIWWLPLKYKLAISLQLNIILT